MATLTQYWSDEVTRIGAALATAQASVATLRSAVLAAEADQRSAAEAERSQSAALAAARRALAAIAMPADGDPLLAAMESALVALRAAQAARAQGEYQRLVLRTQLDQAEQSAARLASALTAAQQALARETAAAAARQDLVDLLTTGSLANLASDAADALTNFQATATARVAGEFPTSATASEDFLGRVRARRALVKAIADSAAGVETAAYSANHPALDAAQRDFDAAVVAVQAVADAAAQLAADNATLSELAALPAPNPPTSYSILTRWEHDLLHDASKKTQRETTLGVLTAVDAARSAVIAVQVAYDTARNAALKAEPDKTPAQLDATTLSAQKAALDAKLDDLGGARDDYAALPAADRAALDDWFAAVPDALWDALDSLDAAIARLERLKGPPSVASLVGAMNTAESTLEAALRAARLAQRQDLGGQAALVGATAQLAAQRDTVARRASAMVRSNTLF